jgi:hypothetical protein
MRAWVAGWLVVAFAGDARAREIVRIEHRSLNRLHSEAFRLHRPVNMQVRCEGSGDAKNDKMFAYGWIVNLRTREIEWRLTHREARRTRGTNFAFEGAVKLDEGEYAAYFAPYTQRYKSIVVLGKEIGRYLISSKRKPRHAKYWGLWISTADVDDDAVEKLEAPAHVNDPRRLVDLTRMGDDDFDSHGFTLPESMRITVYCQGEYVDRESGAADVGWIIDADSRRRVWEFGPDNFRHGGGAEKNKLARETITLSAGNYVASYATDGSHSYEAWNEAPPLDPEGWGLILWAQTDGDAAKVASYSHEDDPGDNLVALIRQRNGAYVTQGITLKTPARLRVYALGELDWDEHEFVDHGWITDYKTGHRVWEMRPNKAAHAGGHRKNRQSEEVIQLPQGSYVVWYSTDDSHAYREWNATPPYDPTHWGISVMAADNSFSKSDFELFDREAREAEGQDFLVRMVRIGDNAHKRQSFELGRHTSLRIVALGEGLYNQMYDYAWIEEKRSGAWIWEMTMRNTRHAGGARKNRVFDGNLDLKAGEYVVHYVSDDSHSWNNFNETRPRNANAWGITITTTN